MVYPEDPRFYVRQEYEARHARNPSYSWRSFARDLKMSPSMLSEFLKGRYGLSRTKAGLVAEMIRLDADHTDHFIDLLEADFHRAGAQREMAKLRIQERMMSPATHLNRETFAHILDWTYFALLEIVGLEKGKINPLGWTTPFRNCALTMQRSVTKLLDLKLLRREGDNIVPSSEITIANEQMPPDQIQSLHTQVLGLGQMALQDLTPSERETVSVFGSINSEDFSDLKRELNDTFLQVLNRYSSRAGPNAVYCFAYQAFPIYRKTE